jgi:hypothetical protein
VVELVVEVDAVVDVDAVVVDVVVGRRAGGSSSDGEERNSERGEWYLWGECTSDSMAAQRSLVCHSGWFAIQTGRNAVICHHSARRPS